MSSTFHNNQSLKKTFETLKFIFCKKKPDMKHKRSLGFQFTFNDFIFLFYVIYLRFCQMSAVFKILALFLMASSVQ